MSANAIDPALDECSVAGNNNIYGLGIRLSIYVQGFITMIAYCYKQESFKSLSTANSILRVALLLAIMYITASSPESLTSIEAVVVCGLIACLYAESANVHYTWYVPKEFTNDEIRRCWNSLGWWRTLLQYIWLFGYALWFLMKGLGGVLPPAHPNCGPEVVFVLARVRLDEKWLKIVAMILFSAVALPGLISIVLFSLPAKYRDACIEALNDPTPTKFTRSWRQIVKRTSRYGLRHSEWNIIGNGIWFVLLVLFVELPIRWNNIIGVDSLKEADQLIPFFVAISNCYVLWNEWGKPLAREEYKVQQVPESDAEAEPFQMKDMYQPEGSHIP